MTALPVIHSLRARHGRASPDAPNVLVIHDVPQRPPLYLLLECLNDNDSLTTKMVAACADAYRKARGSLTGALQAIIRAADSTLRQMPLASVPICGLSALLISQDEALLAQVEPTVCWLLRDGRLLRWPADSVWLDESTSDSLLRQMSGGLGREQVAPDLIRIPLQAGDRLLLGTISAARQVGELLIAQSLAREDAGAALHELVPDLDFTALSIAPIVSRGLAPDANRAPATESLASYTTLAKRAPRPKASTEVQSEPATQAESDRRAFPRAAQQAKRSNAPTSWRERAQRIGGPRAFQWPNLRPYLEVVVVAVLFICKFVWLIVSALLRLLSRALPEREAAPSIGRPSQVRRPVMQSNPMESRVLVGLAIAIPVLVLLSIVILRNQTATAQTSRFADLLARASSAYQNAMSMQDASARKTELLKASQLADEAVNLSPRDTSAKEVRTKIANELDKLNNVTKFFFYPLLYEFKDKDSRPSVVIARGIDVYVLDTGLNRLYKFLLNDAKDNIQPNPNPIVMRQGDERGAIVVGRLADIFFATAGGGRSSTGVLTLTQSKQVIEYLPAKGINVLNLGAATGWQEATLAESFNGNLYILDAKANHILKYMPTGEDYKNPPTDYLAAGEKVDFAGAVDMAIDGFVYVLLADGTLMKFDTGHLIPFDKKGLEIPLKKPVALVAQANSPSIYIADAGNKRIVQLGKSGDYQRTLKPDDPSVMSDLRGLSVDETTRRFYFINGNRLYMGTLQN